MHICFPVTIGRREWILQAFNQFNFNLSIAAGIKVGGDKAVNDIRLIENRYAYAKNKMKIKMYEHNEMANFYNGISCYLVPDQLPVVLFLYWKQVQWEYQLYVLMLDCVEIL